MNVSKKVIVAIVEAYGIYLVMGHDKGCCSHCNQGAVFMQPLLASFRISSAGAVNIGGVAGCADVILTASIYKPSLPLLSKVNTC